MNNDKDIEKSITSVKKSIASANINFLIGSGMSMDFLQTLTGIEDHLSKAEKEKDSNKIKSLKKKYFENSILGNIDLEIDFLRGENCENVLDQYKKFYQTINSLILQRESSLLSKQVNIFTTNIDIFSEIALEEVGVEFNDGFHGRFNPKYNVGNFKKSYYKTSLHYENTSEIPVFNIIKLHGSVSWLEEDKDILLDKALTLINKIKKCSEDNKFEENYDKLMIVNPSKKKFEDTVLNEIYYDLLRIYNNELEKENSVLFVMGFSFADEHIREITLRLAKTNPTSIVYIFVYDNDNEIYTGLKNSATNNNIFLLTEKKYDFKEINNFFSAQLNKKYQQSIDNADFNK